MKLTRAPLDAWLLAGRRLRRSPREPDVLFGALGQTIMFTLLFAYVFGGAIAIPGGGSYREYLVPAIMVQVMAFASAITSAGMAGDMASGLVDRFRSLPIARSAVVAGRALADLVLCCVQLALVALVGLAVGWRVHTGPLDVLAGFGLILLAGFAFIWVGTWIGLMVRSVEASNSVGLVWLFPVTFVANAFVPLNGMPSWLRPIASWNPISAMTAACRQLFGNPTTASNAWPLAHPVTASILWSLALIVVFAFLAVRRYQAVSSR